MSLVFSGRTSTHHDGGLAVEATDATTGKHVPVRISDEAIQDHGLGRAKQAAERKYVADQLTPAGGVFVSTADVLP